MTIKIALEDSTVISQKTPAPEYSVSGGSSMRGAKFHSETQYLHPTEYRIRNAEPRALLKNLRWCNENGCCILELSGCASVKMLRQLSAALIDISDRMDNQLTIIDGLEL